MRKTCLCQQGMQYCFYWIATCSAESHGMKVQLCLFSGPIVNTCHSSGTYKVGRSNCTNQLNRLGHIARLCFESFLSWLRARTPARAIIIIYNCCQMIWDEKEEYINGSSAAKTDLMKVKIHLDAAIQLLMEAQIYSRTRFCTGSCMYVELS